MSACALMPCLADLDQAGLLFSRHMRRLLLNTYGAHLSSQVMAALAAREAGIPHIEALLHQSILQVCWVLWQDHMTAGLQHCTSA